MKSGPTALGRLVAVSLAIGGAVVASQPVTLLVGYCSLLLPILAMTQVLRAHAKFLITIVLPVAVMALVVWPGLIGAPPGELTGSDTKGALRFALLIIIRLSIVGGIFQATILSLDPAQLSGTLWRWRIRGDSLIAVLAAVVLVPEMNRRADRILTAASARGLLRSRSLWQRTRILFISLSPLLAWCLRAAIKRADTWHERRLLARLDMVASTTRGGTLLVDLPLIGLCTIWFVLNAADRWSGAWQS